jgi:hypothetical protein
VLERSIVFKSLGAVAIAATVASQVTQTRERRAARSDVRSKIAAVERLRWNSTSNSEFHQAIGELESAAIVAGLPPRPVHRYVEAVKLAAVMSRVAAGGGDEPTSKLSDECHVAMWDALHVLSRHLWHPLLGRLRWGSLRRRSS